MTGAEVLASNLRQSADSAHERDYAGHYGELIYSAGEARADGLPNLAAQGRRYPCDRLFDLYLPHQDRYVGGMSGEGGDRREGTLQAAPERDSEDRPQRGDGGCEADLSKGGVDP